MTHVSLIFSAVLGLGKLFLNDVFGVSLPLDRERRGWPWVEPQTSVSGVLRAENEQTTQGQAAAADAESNQLAVPETMNECWSADFMSDALWDGRRFRTFNVVDDFSREALANRSGLQSHGRTSGARA